MKRFPVAVALLLTVAACGDSGGSTDTDGGTTQNDGGSGGTIEPKLSVIATKIFEPKCVVCHGDPPAFGGITLTAAKAFDQLVNKPVTNVGWPAKYTTRVVPGDTATSALSASVEQRSEIPVDLHMPSAGSKLSQAEITAINTWIQDGAQNN
jgi:hypothetical protein